jgi:hypothetical protein
MKITKQQLKQIIKEELSKVLSEAFPPVPSGPSTGYPSSGASSGFSSGAPPTSQRSQSEEGGWTPHDIMCSEYLVLSDADKETALKELEAEVASQKDDAGVDPKTKAKTLVLLSLLRDYVRSGYFKGKGKCR